jgi:hypothetical protein
LIALHVVDIARCTVNVDAHVSITVNVDYKPSTSIRVANVEQHRPQQSTSLTHQHR